MKKEKTLKTKIFLTIVLYFLDILIFGSIAGLVLVAAYGIENIFLDKNNNLTKMYIVGILYYWITDSFISKIRESYKEAEGFQ